MPEAIASPTPREKSAYEKTLEARVAEVQTLVANSADRHKVKAQSRLTQLQAELTEVAKR